MTKALKNEIRAIHRMINKELYHIRHSPIGWYYRTHKKQHSYDVSKSKVV